MFLSTTSGGYNRSGDQVASGLFLVLLTPPYPAPVPPLRALVRHARLTQMGHFMMGTIQVGRERLTISGTYGSDGLPLTVSQAIYDAGVLLPDDLYQRWSTGGGHNGGGSETPAIQTWGRQHLAELRAVKP